MSDRNLWIKIGARTEGLMAGLKEAEQGVKRFNTEVQKSAEKKQALNELGGSFTRLGLLAVGASAFAVKMAMDWQQAWTGVLKTVDGTDQQLQALEGSLRNLATQTGFAHAEVAGVAEAAGQLGISTDGVAAFTETMLAMGVSTNMSAEEAATGLARFRNIMGSTESEVENMGSTIVGLGNNFATTEGEILAMSLRLAGAGRQAGLTEADVMGLATAMSSVGIEAQAGGTAMSLTMKRVGKEVDNNGPKLQTFARVAGMSADAFAAAWKKDAGSALTAFVAGLDDASRSGESVNAILTDLGITGIRESDALLRLSGNAEGMAAALGMAGEEWSRNTALMEEAQKFYDTTAQKGKQAWAEIKDAGISAGDALLPVVAKMFDAVGGVANAFEKVPAPVSASLVAITGIGGASLLAVGGMIKLYDSVTRTTAALRALELSGARGGAFLGGVGRGAARAAVAVAALAAVQAAGEAVTSRNAKELDALGNSLLKFANTGKVNKEFERLFGDDMAGKQKRFARDVRSIGEALADFDKFGDDSWYTRLYRRTVGQGELTGQAGLIYEQMNFLRDADAVLSKMAAERPEEAIKSFEALRDRALETGGSVEELGRAFPRMTELLKSAASANGEAGTTAEVLTGNLEDLAPAAQATAEAMAAQMESTTGAALSFVDFSKGIDDASLSLKSWIDGLVEMQRAQDEWADNVIRAVNRGVSEGVIREFEAMGPAGAKMLADLVNGPQKEIDRLNGLFDATIRTADDLAYILANFPDAIVEFKAPGADGAIAKAVEVATAYEMSPTEVRTILEALDYASEDIEKVLSLLGDVDGRTSKAKVSVDIAAALNNLSRVRTAIDSVTGKTVTVGVRVPGGTQMMASGGVLDFYANGGLRENHVAQIAPAGSWRIWAEPETGGEAYIPLAHHKRERSLEIWAETGRRLGVQGFANGGVSGGQPGGFRMTLSGPMYLESGELLGIVSGVAVQAAESTAASVQRFDRSQASAWR